MESAESDVRSSSHSNRSFTVAFSSPSGLPPTPSSGCVYSRRWPSHPASGIVAEPRQSSTLPMIFSAMNFLTPASVLLLPSRSAGWKSSSITFISILSGICVAKKHRRSPCFPTPQAGAVPWP